MRLKRFVGGDPPGDEPMAGFIVDAAVDAAEKAATEQLLATICPPCILKTVENMQELWVQPGGDAEVLFELFAAHFIEPKTVLIRLEMTRSELFDEEVKVAFPSGPYIEENQDAPA